MSTVIDDINSATMKMLAKKAAIFVPIAVPCV